VSESNATIGTPNQFCTLADADISGCWLDDVYPPDNEPDLRAWYNIGAPIKGVLWRAAKLHEDQARVALELKSWYTFVVFENGAPTSVAEVKLKVGVRQ
jgi:hypothetical protein